MRDWVVFLSVLFVLLCVGYLFTNSGATAGDPPRTGDPILQTWIDDLGSSSFSVRQKASKQIEALGPAVLPRLRAIKETNDPEVNFRVRQLINKLEEKALVDALLAPKRVRLNVKDQTVLEAVGVLKKISGEQIELTGNLTGLTKKITLDTGEVTFWEALQQLCVKGGMIEHPMAPYRNPSPSAKYYRRGSMQPPPLQSRAIVLAEGGQLLLPTCFHGSIRIRTLTPDSVEAALQMAADRVNGRPPAGPGKKSFAEPSVAIEVVAEQRLQNFGVVGALYFDKSIDDQGQNLEWLPEHSQPIFDPSSEPGIAFKRIRDFSDMGQKVEPRRIMVFRFKPGPRPSRIMKELSGKLILQALGPVEPLVQIKDIRQVVGKTVRGKDDNAIQVRSAEHLENNMVRLKVTLEYSSDAGAVLGNPKFAGIWGGDDIKNRAAEHYGNQLPINWPMLVDAQGRKYLPKAQDVRHEFGNPVMLRHATLTYHLEREANQLMLEGQRPIWFAVPIRLKDIPLR